MSWDGALTPAVIVAFFSATIAFVGFAYSLTRNRQMEANALHERIATLETKIDLFWRAFCTDAAKILHSPDPRLARRDELIDAFLAEEISGEDLEELVDTLKEVVADHDAAKGERLAASILIRGIQTRYLMEDHQ